MVASDPRDARNALLDRFIAHLCEAHFAARDRLNPDAPNVTHSGKVQITHDLAIVKQEVSQLKPKPLPPLADIAQCILEKVATKRARCAEGRRALHVVLQADLVRRKAELLYILNDLSEQVQSGRANPALSTEHGPSAMPTRAHTLSSSGPSITTSSRAKTGTSDADSLSDAGDDSAEDKRVRRRRDDGSRRQSSSEERGLPVPPTTRRSMEGTPKLGPRPTIEMPPSARLLPSGRSCMDSSYESLGMLPGSSNKLRSFSRLQAASSLSPSCTDGAAIIRDVIYCLQGIDGQHIRYQPEKLRFLLHSQVPLARSLKILCSRMVSSGNLYMRLVDNTRGSDKALLPPLSMNAAHRATVKSGWLNDGGKIDEECKAMNRETSYAPVYHYNEVQHIPSLVGAAFMNAIRDELAAYYDFLGNLESFLLELERSMAAEPVLDTMPAAKTLFSSGSLRQLTSKLRAPLKRIHTLATLVDITAGKIGTEILTILNDCQLHGDPTRAALTRVILEKSWPPLNKFIRNFITTGDCTDEYQEFFVRTQDVKSTDYYEVWKRKLKLDWSMVPGFFTRPFASRVFSVGQLAHLIGVIKGPAHFVTVVPGRRLSMPPSPPSMAGTEDNRAMSVFQEVPQLLNKAFQRHQRLSMDPVCDPMPLLTSGDSVMDVAYRQCDSASVVTQVQQAIADFPLAMPPVQCRTQNVAEGVTDLLGAAEISHKAELHRILFEEGELMTHLHALHSFLLLGAGDFVEVLMEKIRELVVESGGVSGIVQSEIDLHIQRAIHSSSACNRFKPAILDRLRGQRTVVSERFGSSPWDFFTLDYVCDDTPASLVIRRELLAQYRLLFSFLWKIRRTYKQQQGIWHTTMRNSFLLSFPSVAEVLIDSQSLRNEIIHFVGALEAFFVNDVFQPTYDAMIQRYNQREDLGVDELCEIHESYMQALLYGSFLASWPPAKTLDNEYKAGVGGSVDGDVQVLANVHSTFLSKSCLLPGFGIASEEPSRDNNPGLAIDNLLDLAGEFAVLMDQMHYGAHSLVSQRLEEFAGPMPDEQQVADGEEFRMDHSPALQDLRDRFAESLRSLIFILKDMRERYRSPAIDALLTRMDMTSYY